MDEQMNTMITLADQLESARERKKELEDETKTINAEIDELDKKLSDAMAEAECESFKHNSRTFYIKTRLFASPVAGHKDEMIRALKENGYADLVVESVNANTLSSFCKELLEANIEDENAEGDPELPGWLKDVVSTYEKVSVGIRKS